MLKTWLNIQFIFILFLPAILSVNCERLRTVEHFTIVVLPDTQHYSEMYPGIFTAQTKWIVNNKESSNIVFVTHEGDIVDSPDSKTEWKNANSAMSILDGIVPYGMAPGNHDQSAKYYNNYFGYTRYEDESWYGGHYGDNNDNNFQLFSTEEMDFIIIHLEYNPSAAVLEWADFILETYSNRKAILTTHTFLETDGTRNDIGERIFDNLKDNNNLFLILCGHNPGEASRTDNVNGNTIYQLLANYQNSMTGWLRVMRFSPNEDVIYVETYSPTFDEYETDEDSRFVLDYDFNYDDYYCHNYRIESVFTSLLDPSNWLAIAPVLAVFAIGLAILFRIAIERFLRKK